MGGSSSKLSEQDLEEFTQLTYLNRQQVLSYFRRFRQLDPELVDSAPLEHRVSARKMANGLPEIKLNPFCDRILAVFSSSTDMDASSHGGLSFEDFLDLASALGEYAPPEVKADWAFRMFDFDGDDAIGPEDIKEAVRRVTTGSGSGLHQDQSGVAIGGEEHQPEGEALTGKELNKIVKQILLEADLNKTGAITRQEFRYIMSKSPDFAQNFRLRL